MNLAAKNVSNGVVVSCLFGRGRVFTYNRKRLKRNKISRVLKMEEELRCFVCKNIFNNPVLLPCYHSLCLHCAINLQQPANQQQNGQSQGEAESVASGNSDSNSSEYQEADKLSILSETDSGVVCTSRPNSYVGTPNLNNFFPPLSNSVLSLSCPVCSKLVYFDENGAYNLPKYRVMQSIVEKYGEIKNLLLKCQMCESEPANEATISCEQCEIFYCEQCREVCHPLRGPLAKHNLVEPKRNSAKFKGRDGKCFEHEDESLTMYCMVCKIAVCALCLHDTRHNSHDVQAISSMCKAQKVRQHDF